MRMRGIWAGVLLALVGCGGGGSDGGSGDGAAQSADDRITLAVIPKGTQHNFWKSIHAGAVKASREVDVDIIWKGPVLEDDREAQIAEVENFIARGVSGIVLAPLDDKALRAPVRNAKRRGIPVVIVDSGMDSEDYVSFVATDNLAGGRLAGERMVKQLGNKGKVIMLRYQVGSASTMKREQGFLDVVAEHPDIEVLSSNQHAGATVESAQQMSENLLDRFRNPDGTPGVDGIFCPAEPVVFGMLRALQDAGHAGSVTLVGFDATEQLVRGLETGEIDSLVIQDPVNMGYLGVKMMAAHLRGETIEPLVDTGVNLITKLNMDEPAMRELLSPDLAQWLN